MSSPIPESSSPTNNNNKNKKRVKGRGKARGGLRSDGGESPEERYDDEEEEKDIDPIATALRESQEEIGLKADQVEIIGSLGVLALPSGFLVKPIVGLIDPGLSYTPQPEEVADIFHMPLDLVLDVSAYKKSQVEFKGVSRTILELQFDDYRVWGATAAILYHLATEISKFCE